MTLICDIRFDRTLCYAYILMIYCRRCSIVLLNVVICRTLNLSVVVLVLVVIRVLTLFNMYCGHMAVVRERTC